jgi:hypothetical protein
MIVELITPLPVIWLREEDFDGTVFVPERDPVSESL